MTADVIRDNLFRQLSYYHQSLWCGIKCNEKKFLDNAQELSRLLFLFNNAGTCGNQVEIDCIAENYITNL